MGQILGIVAPVFWGALLLSLLVFVHEGGHYLAARACGVRVSEFFLGLPCRFNLHRVSRRSGTKFGVTPLLLGGYAMICGMEPLDDERAADVLYEVHRSGSVTVGELSERLEVDPERALDLCIALMGWGSVAGYYDPKLGERDDGKRYPSTFRSVPRDAEGFTLLDGRRFDAAGATSEGDPWEPPFGAGEFLDHERARTYTGKGFWARAAMLVAGIAVNIVAGFLLMVVAYSVIGYDAAVDVNVLGGVEAGSVAEAAGLCEGDAVLSVDGVDTPTWTALSAQVQAVQGAGEVEILYERDGEVRTTAVELPEGSLLGISATVETIRLSPLDAARMAGLFVIETARGVAQLLVPTQTMQVLDSSTSVVGISVMSAQAAAAGPAVFLSFASLISFSLGFMNLLPIPPLDGGKLFIEVVQAVVRRRVPQGVVNALSLIGVALFLALFVYMLRADVLRFF